MVANISRKLVISGALTPARLVDFVSRGCDGSLGGRMAATRRSQSAMSF